MRLARKRKKRNIVFSAAADEGIYLTSFPKRLVSFGRMKEYPQLQPCFMSLMDFDYDVTMNRSLYGSLTRQQNNVDGVDVGRGGMKIDCGFGIAVTNYGGVMKL
ncbi:uncharacterized protein A4U43_C08F6210 [Asparagus officinalis]|nr:uncharacterized protein A4U43_C08F6210 [Asparagus officinalis]